MSKLTLYLLACIAVGVSWLTSRAFAYADGYRQGTLEASAKRDGDLVTNLQQVITASTNLTTEANTSSQQLRQSISRFETQYEPVIKEFNDALTESATSRTGCVFSPGVMRQLQAAQQRAATAARQGLPGSGAAAVPGAAAPAGKPRR